MGHDVEEIDAERDEQVLKRVAAIAVAKASAKMCVRIPGKQRRITRVWDVAVTTNAITALADELAELRIERVALEATSDYWRPFFYLLEACGLCVWLVNARDVKNVPGRPKTNKLDAVWLAKLNERGMLRTSFVPPPEIRELRDYTRLRAELVKDRSRHRQRLEKFLEDALIKLSTVETDIFGKSGRAMFEALIAGERDPQVLAHLALGEMRKKTVSPRTHDHLRISKDPLPHGPSHSTLLNDHVRTNLTTQPPQSSSIDDLTSITFPRVLRGVPDPSYLAALTPFRAPIVRRYSTTSSLYTTSVYFIHRSRRDDRCEESMRSPTPSATTATLKFMLTASIAVARTHPLVETPVIRRVSTFIWIT